MVMVCLSGYLPQSLTNPLFHWGKKTQDTASSLPLNPVYLNERHLRVLHLGCDQMGHLGWPQGLFKQPHLSNDRRLVGTSRLKRYLEKPNIQDGPAVSAVWTARVIRLGALPIEVAVCYQDGCFWACLALGAEHVYSPYEPFWAAPFHTVKVFQWQPSNHSPSEA